MKHEGDLALFVIGMVLIFFGVISIWIGDKKIHVGDEFLIRLFSTSQTMAKWRKWLIGLGAIYVGFMVIDRSGWLF